MKVKTHTPSRLVFEHRAMGMGVLAGLLLVVGLAAGGATITMHEEWSLSDEFVRIGLGMIGATLLAGFFLVWKGVRIRRLTLDAEHHEVRYRSRGLGRTKQTVWMLHELEAVEVGTYHHSSTRVYHITVLKWSDGDETRLTAMDGPTVGRIEENVRVINRWLAEVRAPAS